ncbi:MAG: HAD family hydrolase [Lachnospiraceae bacterium]|nr:HAD family hydrolase [Lachnospiraceae bacterium]
MGKDKKRIALLSNITADLLAGKLRRKYEVYIPDGYDAWIQEVLNPSSGLYAERPDAVILLLDGTEAREWKSAEEGAEKTGVWKQTLSRLAEEMGSVPVFVSTLDLRENRIRALSERGYAGLLENEWYQHISELAESRGNIFLFDFADLVRDMGRRQFYSDKMWYMGGMPYSRDGLNALSSEIDSLLSSAFCPRKKVIVLDLDNTLWGGVIGEDGLDGIVLSNHKEGQRYYDFQRQLLEMKKRGILLAINSKNNPEDAEEVLEHHPFMLLSSDDFVIRKVNWNSKARNLKEMISVLNITEGGFIFIDDNPMERETVKGECPEVTVPEFPADSSLLSEYAENIWKLYLRPLRVLGEDWHKTRMYRSEMERQQIRKESLNLDDYIHRLEMRADIHRMRPEEVDRVVQLCGKTNQFNLTTVRYTKAEIEEMSRQPDHIIYTVHTADKYGDNGLVSVIVLQLEEEAVHAESFLMSCRVMGRKLEDIILGHLVRAFEGRERFTGEYIPTAKNAPVKDLYGRLGFMCISDENGHRKYELLMKEKTLPLPDVYKEVRFEA